MKFFVLMCILVAASICAATEWYDIDDMQFQIAEIAGCSGKRMQLNRRAKEVECTPRPMLKKLSPPPGYIFFPDFVSVNRCSGLCPRNKACMPVMKKIKQIIVRMDSYNSSNCYFLNIEEHTKCKCQCSVKKSHCNIYQEYSEKNCACECKNRKTCNRMRHMIWSEKLCNCICNKPEEVCSTGLEWVPSLCGCARVMEMPYVK